MVNVRIDEITALGAEAAAGDLVEVQDISDTTDHANGTSKKVTVGEIRGDVTYSLATRAQTGSTVTRGCGVAPITGTITNVQFLSSGNTSSDASNYWTIDVQNKSNASASFLAAAYNTNTGGDLATLTLTDLGALHGTAANLDVTKDDVLQIVWTETGTATSLYNDTAWVVLTITPA